MNATPADDVKEHNGNNKISPNRTVVKQQLNPENQLGTSSINHSADSIRSDGAVRLDDGDVYQSTFNKED